VGEVVHTLPEGEAVVGVTSLAGEIYVLRERERDRVEVYDATSYRLLRRLTVPYTAVFIDMTACEHNLCMYIAVHVVKPERRSSDAHKLHVDADSIHRLEAQGVTTHWPVNDKPAGLSVNASHNLLVTCPLARKIKEFSSRGNLLRELALPDNVIHPHHAIQTRINELIVCHGDVKDTVHRVCKISEGGRHVDPIQSHGGQKGSDIGQYHEPHHVAVDNNEFVLVADVGNRRVTLLSPTLRYIRQVVTGDDLKWKPHRLYLDTQRRRLYVADSNMFYAGRVVVFSV